MPAQPPPTLFSNSRIGRDESLSVERGGEGAGGEEPTRVNERHYRALTCFGLISAGCFVPEPLALIWGPQHLELIITHTPALALQLTVYVGYYIHSNSNFIQLMVLTHCCADRAPVHLHKIQRHDASKLTILWRFVQTLCSV